MKTILSHKEQILKASFGVCHVCYFAGVASGVHEMSAYGAAVILGLMAVSRICHIHLEG